jgi:hypothetical protein
MLLKQLRKLRKRKMSGKKYLAALEIGLQSRKNLKICS